MWQHWVNFIAAIWVVISPYVGFTSSQMTTNLIITGVIVGILALWGGLETSGRKMGTMAR
jgi:hypothetical protein